MVAKQFAGKVTVVGVAWQGDEKSFQGFVAKHKLTFPNIADLDSKVFAHFKVPGQPAWVFVDKSGTAKRSLGALDDATLERALAELAA